MGLAVFRTFGIGALFADARNQASAFVAPSKFSVIFEFATHRTSLLAIELRKRLIDFVLATISKAEVTKSRITIDGSAIFSETFIQFFPLTASSAISIFGLHNMLSWGNYTPKCEKTTHLRRISRINTLKTNTENLTSCNRI